MVAYLAVALNTQAQKTMDYYEMFWMNSRGDAHSTRNKGRLTHERDERNGMLCVENGQVKWTGGRAR